MAEIKKRSGCPISSSLDIWGDKWSLLIIRDLMFNMQCTYGDFLKADEHISTNILASRLQTLEMTGVISKAEHPDSKAKVLYKLTEKGIDLLPAIIEISLWGGKYFDISDNHRAIQQEILKDKEGFLKRITINLKNTINK